MILIKGVDKSLELDYQFTITREPGGDKNESDVLDAIPAVSP